VINDQVVTAASGAEAVRAAASSRPDLVLLDVMMPDGDGFEALRRIRSGGSEVPVIFLTARDEVPARARGFDVGDDARAPANRERRGQADTAPMRNW
jgi:DNA-binding response OmpR family regulator